MERGRCRVIKRVGSTPKETEKISFVKLPDAKTLSSRRESRARHSAIKQTWPLVQVAGTFPPRRQVDEMIGQQLPRDDRVDKCRINRAGSSHRWGMILGSRFEGVLRFEGRPRLHLDPQAERFPSFSCVDGVQQNRSPRSSQNRLAAGSGSSSDDKLRRHCVVPNGL